MKRLISALAIMRAIHAHPMNRKARLRAAARFLKWQTASRLAPGPIVVPFIDETVLVMSAGMTGATGNLYFGLAEWEEMAFVAHLLRPGDLFVDVGANIGAFAVLAAGACGARAVAIEPIAPTFKLLERNIAINRLDGLVEAVDVGLGAQAGERAFIGDRDTMNRVAVDGENGTPIAVRTLDEVMDGRVPTLIKIDVEGFEAAVLEGARRTIGEAALMGVIVESAGQEVRYGYSPGAAEELLAGAGFTRVRYDPLRRRLHEAGAGEDNNAIFVRDRGAAAERVAGARPIRTVAGAI